MCGELMQRPLWFQQRGPMGERGHKVGKQVSFVVNVSGTVLKFWPGSRDIKQFDNLDFPRPARIS